MNKRTSEEVKNGSHELTQSDFIRRLSKRYPIKIFRENGKIVIQINLCDSNGKLVDVLELVADCNGLLSFEQAVSRIVVAWEIGLNNSDWIKQCKRIRKMKF